MPSTLFWGGLLLWLTRELWGAVVNRRRNSVELQANVTLVDGLTKRVSNLEMSLVTLEARIAEEMALRMAAQEQAHRLSLDVLSLKSQLRRLGAVFPEEA